MEFNRSDAILKYIVEYFIKHAQPVSSQTLIDEYKLPYSSATIRNEMFALEKLGLIEKTHTSSGRVPSSEGYKYYCEHLRNKDISEEFKNSIQTILDSKVQSVEEVIKESCEILSHMTSLVSVVMGPDEKAERLASMQMIQISDNFLLLSLLSIPMTIIHFPCFGFNFANSAFILSFILFELITSSKYSSSSFDNISPFSEHILIPLNELLLFPPVIIIPIWRPFFDILNIEVIIPALNTKFFNCFSSQMKLDNLILNSLFPLISNVLSNSHIELNSFPLSL